MKICLFLALLLSVALSSLSLSRARDPSDALYPLMNKRALKRVKTLVKSKKATVAFAEGTTSSQKRYIVDVLTGKKNQVKTTRAAEEPVVQIVLGCGLCGF